jgi:hypothetical protein
MSVARGPKNGDKRAFQRVTSNDSTAARAYLLRTLVSTALCSSRESSSQPPCSARSELAVPLCTHSTIEHRAKKDETTFEATTKGRTARADHTCKSSTRFMSMMQEAILRCEKANAATGACELAADARHGPSASVMVPKITLMCISEYCRHG